jgi:NitT/TauT family transport system permease protein
MVFFLVFFSTYQGIRNVDERQINSVRLMGASSWQVRRYVVLPGARANVFLGLKLGIPEALVGAVVGEFISSSKGLGYSIQYATAQFDTAGVFAGIIVLGAVAIALNYVVAKAAQSSSADRSGL